MQTTSAQIMSAQNTSSKISASDTLAAVTSDSYTSDTYASMMTAIFGAFEHPMLPQAVDTGPQDEDDAVMDSWLASLAPREFEMILSDLAGDALDSQFALEPTA